MTEEQLLLAVLIVIWAGECFVRLPRGGIAIVRRVTGWRILAPPANRGGPHGSFALASAIPIVGIELLAYPWVERAAQLTEEELAGVARWGNEVTLGTGERVELAGIRAAESFEALGVSLHGAAPEARAHALEQAWNEALDDRAIESRRAAFDRQRGLEWFCATQAIWLVLAAPVLTLIHGFTRLGLLLIGVALGLDLVIAILFWLASRRLFPEERFARWAGAATMIVSPASAVAATRHLARPLLADKHPIAIVAATMPREALLRFARRWLAEHPAAHGPIAAYLAAKGISGEDLSRIPQREDDACRTFCPVCEAQYTLATGACSDCGAALVNL